MIFNNIDTELENTDDYDFILSKEIDQEYNRIIDIQLGESRMESLNKIYLDSHIEQFKEKLETVFKKINKYEFEFSFLIATSYLEELINEAFKQSFDLKKYKKFKEKVNASLTFSFKIEFLLANGNLDEKTAKVLNHIRKIRNHLAHQSVLEETHKNSIKDHIENIEKICDNGILSRPKTIIGIEDEQLKSLIPVIENLCLAIIRLIQYVNSFSKIGARVFYTNKGYGTGFVCSYNPQYIDEYTIQHLISKYRDLKLNANDYNKYGFNLNL